MKKFEKVFLKKVNLFLNALFTIQFSQSKKKMDIQSEKITISEERIFLEEGPAAGIQKQNDSVNLNQFGQEPGARRLSDLFNKGEIFESIYLDPKLLSAVANVL